MKLKLRNIIVLGFFVFIFVWFYVFVLHTPNIEETREHVKQGNVHEQIQHVSAEIEENKSLLNQLHSHFMQIKNANSIKEMKNLENHLKSDPGIEAPIINNRDAASKITQPLYKDEHINSQELIIPVLVMACNRPSVSKALDLILKYRIAKNFPIVVSQDGDHMETKKVIQSYGDKLNYIQHKMLETNNIPSKHVNLRGYYKLSAHYKWAVSQAFKMFPSADSLIIVEDDLEISPDFFSYFKKLHTLLLKDKSVMCISAWNDNGKENSIDTKTGETLLYRTDFFPGLGWMLTKDLWQEELEEKWPAAFWDDWLRETEQRKNRACIRPEISRTRTFGRVGVSNGQFYDKHLKFIKLNAEQVDWTNVDTSYLEKENYDKLFHDKLKGIPTVNLSEIGQARMYNEVKIEYTSPEEFKSIAKTLGIMDDFRAGVPRTAYLGVVTSMFNNIRVFVTPKGNIKR